MNIESIIKGGILTSILLISGFFRGIDLPFGLTSSYLVPSLAFMGIGILLFTHRNSRRVTMYKHWYLWIGLIAWFLISFIYNLLFRPYQVTTIRFFAEFSISLAILVVFIYILDHKLLGYVYKSYLVGSLFPAIVLLLFPLYSGFENIRRVGGYELPGAVNNISQMLGVAVIIAVVGIVTADDWTRERIEIVSLPIIGFALLLTGSRSAILGVSISLLLMYILKSDNLIFDIITGALLVIAFLFSFSVVFNYTGWYRFTPSFLIHSLLRRFEVFTIAVIESGTSLQHIVFGGGMYRYEELAAPLVDPIIYPHNYLISLLVHIGLPAAVLFTVLLVLHFRYHLGSMVNGHQHTDYLLLCTIFSMIVVVLYVMTSGRLTRVFTIWIFLGISEFLLVTDTN